MNHDHVWFPDGAEALIELKQTIAGPKRMPTVFWSPIEFSGVIILPKGQHIDGQSFASIILSVIGENRPVQTWEDQSRKTVLRFDNASPHAAHPDLSNASALVFNSH
jgi:hypothetical protein